VAGSGDKETGAGRSTHKFAENLMGVRASLSEVTPAAFAQVRRGGEPKLPDGEWHSIDKAWFDFHSLFGKMGPPLSLVITGDCLHPQSPHTLEDFCRGGHEWYLGYASPELVREAANALSAISTAQVQEWYEESSCGAYDCDFYFFDKLKSAYVSAAEHCNALQILVC
jgi:hypothetical protein